MCLRVFIVHYCARLYTGVDAYSTYRSALTKAILRRKCFLYSIKTFTCTNTFAPNLVWDLLWLQLNVILIAHVKGVT